MSVKSNTKTIDFSDLPLHDVVALVANTVLVAKRAYPDHFRVISDNQNVAVLMSGVTYKNGNILVAKPEKVVANGRDNGEVK